MKKKKIILSSGDRTAKSLSSRLEIGTIPKVKHPARRAKAERSLLFYARTYCCDDGGYFTFPPPEDAPRVVECFAALQSAFEAKGAARPFHIRLGRGEGKTSFMKAAIEWAIVTGKKRFPVCVSANGALAASLVDDIWEHLSSSPELLADFPKVVKPIQFLDGNTRKGEFITYKGKHLKIKKTRDELQLPTYRGEGCGAILRAAGFGSAVRGMNKGKRRPDLLLLDDIQTDEMAHSAEQIAKAVDLIDRGYMKLGGLKRITALMTSTTIQPDDLSEHYAHNGFWKTITLPKVITFPDGWKTDADPWLEYFRLRGEDRISGGRTARDYYLVNRKSMDAGVEVFNPHYFNPEAEDSAIQRALNEWHDLGEEVFMAECQMEPVRLSSVYNLTEDVVMAAANGVPTLQAPRLASKRILATVDVMNEAGLRWTIMGFGENREAAVIAYGRYPSHGNLYDSNAAPAIQDQAVATALGSLLNQFHATRIPVNGEVSRSLGIAVVGIDAGWKSRVVMGVAESKWSLFPGCIFTMKGIPWERFVSRSAGGSLKAGVKADDEWVMELKSKYGGSLLGFHSDYWRETAQRAWFVPPLQPGSLSVWGTKEKHGEFARECVADHLEAKDKLRSGEETWKWTVKGANHLGDCVTMGFALAYWKRDFKTYAQVAGTPSAASAQPRRHIHPVFVPVL